MLKSRILNFDMIRVLGTIFAGLFGLAFGSFLNVCLSRWPAGESIIRPRSHCRQCNRTLASWENVPLVSWIALGGRCRTCRAWIGWRYPLVELAVGGLWALTIWRFFESIANAEFPSFYVYSTFELAVGKMIFYWLIVALAVLDFENLWLPNWITLPGIALGFAFISFTPVLRYVSPKSLYKFTVGFEIELRAFFNLRGIVIAAALVLLIRWVYWLIRRREGIGLGDVKLMAMLAAWLGLPNALLSFGLGVVLGALVAIVMLAVPPARRDSGNWALQKLPLGTFLCIGGIISSLWGDQILGAYQRWAGF